MRALDGIAAADAHLGRPFPLPTAVLPLSRWVEVRALRAGGAEIEWNLDDTRPGSPGRLALYAGIVPPPARPWHGPPRRLEIAGRAAEHRGAELEEATTSLRPVHELRWGVDDLHLRLTAQGPWRLEQLVEIAASVRY